MEKLLLHKLNNKTSKLILLILVIAFYLRVHGIFFGLPYVLDPDESNFLNRILYLFKHFLNPNHAEIPNFFFYLNSILLSVSSFVFSPSRIINLLQNSPENIYLPLRFLSVLFGVGSVAVIYLIGKNFGNFVALLASGFFAVSFLHVKFSQIFSPFSGMVFFSLLSVFYAINAYKNKDPELLKKCTIFAALSASMHYLGALSIMSVIFVLANISEKNAGLNLKQFLKLFLILFLVLNPFFIFYILHFIKSLIQNYVSGYYSYHSNSYFLYLFDHLLWGVGPVVWIFAFSLLKYKNEYDLNILKLTFLIPISSYALLGFLHFTQSGFGAMLVPYFCLAAAMTFNSFYKEAWQEDNKKFVFIILLLFAFWIPLKYTLKYNKLMGLSDTRALAGEWIRSNTSDNFRIVWDKNSVQHEWHDIYDKNVLKKYFDDESLIKNVRKYEIDKKLLEKKYWLKILKKRVDYVIINSLDYETVMRQPGKNPSKKFYLAMKKQYPIITFNPYLREKERQIRNSLIEDLYSPFETLWARERSGPLIWIYKL